MRSKADQAELERANRLSIALFSVLSKILAWAGPEPREPLFEKALREAMEEGRAFLDSNVAIDAVVPHRLAVADRMAAAVDLAVHNGDLDSRSMLADERLSYGDPYTVDEARALLERGRL